MAMAMQTSQFQSTSPQQQQQQQQQQQHLVRVADLPGRGRALVAAKAIKAGEILLSDSPLLLYPASLSSVSSFCSHCFRSISSSHSAAAATTTTTYSSCPSCRVAVFCSPRCLSLSHPHLLCLSLPHLPALFFPNNDTSSNSNSTSSSMEHLLFLLCAYSLPSQSFHILLSLSSSSSSSSSSCSRQQQEQVQDHEIGFLHSVLSSLVPSHLLPDPTSFSPQLTASLLSKDRTNAFALAEPFRPNVPQSLRSARAYAIYPHASLFNHDCLPNACHFDYVDRPADNNTNIIVRALHDIPEGREVCISYFAVNWNYADRQRKLLEDYGFRCDCDRCRVESQWKQDDDGMEEADEQEEELGEGMEEEQDDDSGGADGDFPHAYFFVRYLCDRENCGGTLAPLPPSLEGIPSDVLECNVCGHLRKEGDIGDAAMLEQ